MLHSIRAANAVAYVCVALILTACGGGGGGGSGSTPPPPPPPPPPPAPTVTLTADPTIVRTGATSQLIWATTNATSCLASNGWTGDRSVTGMETVGPFTQSVQFNLSCTGAGGVQAATASLTFRSGTNSVPLVNAGPDQTVVSAAQVQLNGSMTTDDGVATFAWAQTSGPVIALSSTASVSPTFTAPTVTTNTVLTFSLSVSDDEGGSAADTVNITVTPVPTQVTLRGDVLYELVPTGLPGQGLSYPGIAYSSLGPDVLVEALDATTLSVVASGGFDSRFELTVPSQTNLVLRATAQMSRQAPLPLPHWQISVRDLDASGAPLGAIHSYTGPAFNSGAGGTQDLRIPSGWNTSGQLVGPRAAAPFAILNSVHAGLLTVLNELPTANFPPLTMDWGPNNAGDITFYSSNPAARRIVLAGEVNVDTDEYDPAVILHEFGHYVDDSFSRSDSIGGAHSFGERVDMRVAFGEGLATAFSSIARSDSRYRDSFGAGQGNSGFTDIENDSATAEGWYSESSTQELIWDLYDNFIDGSDTLSLGFQPIFSVWRGAAHTQTDALTSIFSFMTAFKQARPADAAAVDALLAGEQILGPAMNAYGSTETNNAGSADVLPIYRDIALGGSIQVRSTNQFGAGNKLSTHRFLRLTLASQANVKFDVTAAAGRDPDIDIYRRGARLGLDMGPSNESFTVNLAAGEYILDVYDCGNADCNDDVPPAPTDITVAVTPN